MKLLILNGSPRKNGNTVKLMRKLMSAAEKNHQIEWVDLIDQNIGPCRGCLGCRPDKECVLPEDDAQIIGRKIQQADGLIIGTPTYWGNMTGPLKNLLDRNVTTFETFVGGSLPKPRQKGKKAVIITTSGAPWPINQLSSQSGGAIRSLKTVLKAGGYKIIGVLSHGGPLKEDHTSARAFKKAEKLGGLIGQI